MPNDRAARKQEVSRLMDQIKMTNARTVMLPNGDVTADGRRADDKDVCHTRLSPFLTELN